MCPRIIRGVSHASADDVQITLIDTDWQWLAIVDHGAVLDGIGWHWLAVLPSEGW
jgi:hypothetical protein